MRASVMVLFRSMGAEGRAAPWGRCGLVQVHGMRLGPCGRGRACVLTGLRHEPSRGVATARRWLHMHSRDGSYCFDHPLTSVISEPFEAACFNGLRMCR